MYLITDLFAPARLRSVLALGLLLLAPQACEHRAPVMSEPEDLVERSRLSVQKIMSDPDIPSAKTYIERASGLLIVPQLIEGAFVVGGKGGAGVLLAQASDGSWSPPAFYTLAGGSVGLQLGGQVSEAVLAIMNEEALEAILANQFELGVDASVAVGPVGAGLGASTTTNLGADVYAFSRAVGLFGGAALDGAAVLAREEWNELYYGQGATPRAIVLERRFFNKQADALRQALPR
jgi:lipid-binding SYLF domain-containing protein